MKTKILRRKVVSVFVLVGLATLLTAGTRVALRANIITVTNTNDSGPGSLRQALVDANDGDTINFDSSLKGQKITLTSGQLSVDKDVTINGLGANNLAVDGNAQSRVFYVNASKTVTIDGLTVSNGYSNSGGGIVNDGGGLGALTLSNCTISGNYGGAIVNGTNSYGAALIVTNCTISGNYGGGVSNGAVFDGRSASLVITNSTVSGNYGSGISSGAFNGDADVAVINCTISGNSAEYGGGISNGAGGSNGSHSTVSVSDSTISGNSATGDGGGIRNVGGTGGGAGVAITNSTLSGNSATGNGGGIYNYGDRRGGAGLTVTNSTLSSNSAEHGGSISNGTVSGGATVAIGDTILSAGDSGENIYNDANGAVTSLGYNVSSDDGSGFLIGPGDQINTDPLLGPLQDNGGPTFTHALLPGSPAIDGGNPSFTPPPYYDQRGPGFDRVVNSRIDVGSFEIQSAPTPTPTPAVTPTPTPTATPRPTPTTRPFPSERPRPTPAPRP